MDKKLMFAWLQAQSQKQQVTPTTLYSKQLGINEGNFNKLATAGAVAGKAAGSVIGKSLAKATGNTVGEVAGAVADKAVDKKLGEDGTEEPYKGSGKGSKGTWSESYLALLETILVELLGKKKFTELMEVTMKGDLVTGKDGALLTPEQSERRRKRLQDFIDIGMDAAKKGDSSLLSRVASSIAAKGGGKNSDLPNAEIPIYGQSMDGMGRGQILGYRGAISKDRHHTAIINALAAKARGESGPESKIQFGQKETGYSGDEGYSYIDRTKHDEIQKADSVRAREDKRKIRITQDLDAQRRQANKF